MNHMAKPGFHILVEARCRVFLYIAANGLLERGSGGDYEKPGFEVFNVRLLITLDTLPEKRSNQGIGPRRQMTPCANLGAVKLVNLQAGRSKPQLKRRPSHRLNATIKRIADAQRANADTVVKARDRAPLARFLRHIARLCGR